MTEWEKLEPIGTRMFRAVPIGFETLPNGRTRAKTIGKEFRETRGYGELEDSVWVAKAMAVIQQDAELLELYTAIRAHMDTHIYFLKKETEKQDWAIGCMFHKAYEHWKDFEGNKTIIWM